MKPSLIGSFFLLAVSAFLSVVAAFATQPTWARKAIAFPSECDVDFSAVPARSSPRTALAPLPGAAACKPIRIPSPDKKLNIEVHYQKSEIEKGYSELVAYFRLRDQNGISRDASFPDGFQDIDLLWSPDSKAFFVNGGNGGGYWGFWVYVYRVDDPDLKPIDITEQAQTDMIKTFPPCKACGIDKQLCGKLARNPENNMSGIDWSGDSSKIVVMAEVPEGGGMGGIRGMVMGYELEVATGNILKRMTAREFKQEWQASMAFEFHDPGQPEYCEKGNSKEIPGCIDHYR
jgi:hypothetical protein